MSTRAFVVNMSPPGAVAKHTLDNPGHFVVFVKIEQFLFRGHRGRAMRRVALTTKSHVG